MSTLGELFRELKGGRVYGDKTARYPGIYDTLCNRLQMYEDGASDRCMQLMTDNPEEEKRRAQLEAWKGVLMDAQNKIARLSKIQTST